MCLALWLSSVFFLPIAPIILSALPLNYIYPLLYGVRVLYPEKKSAAYKPNRHFLVNCNGLIFTTL
ncbi:MAG: hypothetical protein EAY66_04805 [Sphingobacteriales bacterium]|nr:MAG: hypothetical protein EAY66_04805 [Sphingobacteriales bacterium]